jgi:hypothetical protein
MCFVSGPLFNAKISARRHAVSLRMQDGDGIGNQVTSRALFLRLAGAVTVSSLGPSQAFAGYGDVRSFLMLRM